MDSAAAVLAILTKLQSLGFCVDLWIPDDVVACNPSKAFETVLAAFRPEAYPGRSETLPLPAALIDGRRVDLLRLFLSVHSAGGYAALSSAPIDCGWAAAAESAGLDASLSLAVKLLYAKYLGALDRWIQRLVEAQGPFLNGVGWKKQTKLSGEKGVKKQDRNETEKKDMVLKRKAVDMVGMLDWVRVLAVNTQNAGALTARFTDGDGYSMVLAMREVVNRKRARRASMANSTLLQEMFPLACKCCMSSTGALLNGKAKCSEELQLKVPCADCPENMNGSSIFMNQEEDELTAQGENVSGNHHKCSNGWLFTTQQRNEIPIGPEHQAEVPQWTGELPITYDDSETMKWLGTKVWPPETVDRKELFFSDSIGKGRNVVCSCKFPGSVECVRFHVAERRLQLKRELGSAFFAWGFDRMGEEIALSWTDEEEANFKAVAQLSAPSSGRNFWNRLQLSFNRKGRHELVSYYFNCFLLRRRCYQNRITPQKIDSDDEEETEFRFFGNRLGHSAAKCHNTKHTVYVQNRHHMDLD